MLAVSGTDNRTFGQHYFKGPTSYARTLLGNSTLSEGIATESTAIEAKHGKVVMLTASSGGNAFQSIPGLKDMVYENRMTYAQKWGASAVALPTIFPDTFIGYEFMWANITSYDFGAKVYWNKIPILQDAFRRYPDAEWVWWLDLDIIIMNQSLDLQTHILSNEGMMRNLDVDGIIYTANHRPTEMKTAAKFDPEKINMLIANGGWGMNVGSFLLRRSYWTDWLLEMWADPLATKQDWIFPENDGWTHLYRHHQIVRDATGPTKQRALNPYHPKNPNGAHWEKGDLLVHFAGCGDNPKCKGYWQEMWELREQIPVPESVVKELAEGTAKIENVQKEQPS